MELKKRVGQLVPDRGGKIYWELRSHAMFLLPHVSMRRDVWDGPGYHLENLITSEKIRSNSDEKYKSTLGNVSMNLMSFIITSCRNLVPNVSVTGALAYWA